MGELCGEITSGSGTLRLAWDGTFARRHESLLTRSSSGDLKLEASGADWATWEAAAGEASNEEAAIGGVKLCERVKPSEKSSLGGVKLCERAKLSEAPQGVLGPYRSSPQTRYDGQTRLQVLPHKRHTIVTY